MTEHLPGNINPARTTTLVSTSTSTAIINFTLSLNSQPHSLPMPPPRASRLASRKSVLPDPSLYHNLDDSASSSPQRPQPQPQAKPPPTKRRTRASLESADEPAAVLPPPAKQAKVSANGRARADPPVAKVKKTAPATKGGSRARSRAVVEEEEQEQPQPDELDEGSSRTAKGGSGRAAKKSKTAAASEAKPVVVASTSRTAEEPAPRRVFVVSSPCGAHSLPRPRPAGVMACPGRVGADLSAWLDSFQPRAAVRAGFNAGAAGGSSQPPKGDSGAELPLSTFPPTPHDAAKARRGQAGGRDTLKSKVSCLYWRRRYSARCYTLGRPCLCHEGRRQAHPP